MATELEIRSASATSAVSAVSSVNVCVGRSMKSPKSNQSHQLESTASTTKQQNILDNQLLQQISNVKIHHHPQPISMKLCVCAPTSHAGSFRCRLHRRGLLKLASTPSMTPSSSFKVIGSEKVGKVSLPAKAKKILTIVSNGGKDYLQPRLSRFAVSVCPDEEAGSKCSDMQIS